MSSLGKSIAMSSQIDHVFRVNLIDDYCPSTFEDSAQAPTVTILQNGVSNYAKWTAKAFKFAGQEFDKVYIHCWARVCFNVNGQTCDKGNSCGNRKRRAAGTIGLPRDINGVELDGVGSDENIDEVVLTVGPILLDDRVRPLGNDGECKHIVYLFVYIINIFR